MKGNDVRWLASIVFALGAIIIWMGTNNLNIAIWVLLWAIFLKIGSK